jgi:galactose mutarotase-like enzyme
MPFLFDRSFSRAQLLDRTGDISQFGSIRLGELVDGFERGVRIADFTTGTGLAFTVHIDRGLDIGATSFRGVPLAFRSNAPAAHPAHFEPEGLGWLRAFPGGLLTTCGLTYFGAPNDDEGQALGIHGRASYLPASQIAYGGDWHGDEYELWLTGVTRETRFFGENLVLRRRISAWLGRSEITIEDVVTNEGHVATPHMLLYHCNFGFPLVDDGTELVLDAETRPRDAVAAAGIGGARRLEGPQPGYQENVFYHRPAVDDAGHSEAALVNRRFAGGAGLGVRLRWRAAELPWLVQWKQMGQGAYVCGLEPATNWVEGRATERSEGRLRRLEPGESRAYRLMIAVLDGEELAKPG